MNIFRLIGDLSHVAAILILLLKIWKTRSCSGVSGKTQIMFALCFITRYLDLITFSNFVSVYNTVMKILYLAASIGTVYWVGGWSFGGGARVFAYFASSFRETYSLHQNPNPLLPI